MNNQFTKKMKIGFAVLGVGLTALVVCMIVLVAQIFNPPAAAGVMTVESSGKSVEAVSNVLQISTRDKTGGGAPLKLEEIADSLPALDYGPDMKISYSKKTLENYRFALYKEDFTEVYSESARFGNPEEKGEFIVKVTFSWGTSGDNSIFTENFFKLIYS